MVETDNFTLATANYFKLGGTLEQFFAVVLPTDCADFKPDIIIKLKTDHGDLPIIIDIYNGPSGKRDKEKYNKYLPLKQRIHNLKIHVICTNPQKSTYGHDTDLAIQICYSSSTDTYLDILNLNEVSFKNIGTHTMRYFEDLKYWISCVC